MQWNEIDKTISKTFEFNSYLDGIDFVNEIANLAEQENKFIIATSLKPVVNIAFELKDLKSRAKNFI